MMVLGSVLPPARPPELPPPPPPPVWEGEEGEVGVMALWEGGGGGVGRLEQVLLARPGGLAFGATRADGARALLVGERVGGGGARAGPGGPPAGAVEQLIARRHQLLSRH